MATASDAVKALTLGHRSVPQPTAELMKKKTPSATRHIKRLSVADA